MIASQNQMKEQSASPNEILTTGDVARETGYSITKVRKLCETGKLHAIDSGTGVRRVWSIRRSDLDDFLTPRARGGESIPVRHRSASGRSRQRIDANVPKVF